MEVLENHSLQPLNTFGLNVSARYFADVWSVDELRELLADRKFAALPRMILGGGSNVLFTGNYDGLIIRNRIGGISILEDSAERAIVKSGAGINWHSFVLFAIDKNFPGIENLSLIPGCVGAAPIQNIGAYGVEIKYVFSELNAIDLHSGELRKFTNDECRFGYRDSIFKQEAKNKYAIVDVTFNFTKNIPLNTSYGAIGEELNKMSIFHPTIRDVSNAVIAIRQSKLPDPAVIGNAGSFFKNPEVSAAFFETLKGKFAGIIGHATSTGTVKLAAGWLIEQCGLKGVRNGDVGMHAKQALVLVNYGNATGKELIDHAKKVQETVYEKFGVKLEMEVNIIS